MTCCDSAPEATGQALRVVFSNGDGGSQWRYMLQKTTYELDFGLIVLMNRRQRSSKVSQARATGSFKEASCTISGGVACWVQSQAKWRERSTASTQADEDLLPHDRRLPSSDIRCEDVKMTKKQTGIYMENEEREEGLLEEWKDGTGTAKSCYQESSLSLRYFGA